MAPGLDADPLSFLTDDGAAFLAKHWERGPAVIRASPERRAFFGGLFSWPKLAGLAGICDATGQPLEFGVDVNAARYVDGRRETPNGEVADAASLERLYREEGCTMQVHQPQRFSGEAWRLLAALEAQLGCLVGCNAYLTPPGTQGLAPHWDDVEIFVVQTEGSKAWRLYKPKAPAGGEGDGEPGAARARLLASSHLANQVSGDLDEGEIGEPVMGFTLEVGDVLYMPRGTVHAATAQAGDSAHLTISTYQRWSAADLLQYTVSVGLANPELQPLLPAPLKAGLPPRWLGGLGLGPADAAALAAASGGFGEALGEILEMAGAPPAGGAPAGGKRGGKKAGGSGGGGGGAPAGLAAQLAAACRALADCLEGKAGGGGGGGGGSGLGHRLLQTAADAMAEDFVRSRLPPHPDQLPERGPAPTLDSWVQCVGAGYFRLVPLRGTDAGHEGGCGSDCDEEHDHGHHHGHDHPHGHHGHHDHPHGHGDHHGAEGGAPPPPVGAAAPPAWVRLLSCLRNERGSHMMAPPGSDGDSDSGSESGGEEESESEEVTSDDEEAPEAVPLEASEEVLEFSEGGALGGGEAGGQAAALRAELGRLAAAAGRKRKELEAGEGEEDDEDEDEEDEDEGEGGGSDGEGGCEEDEDEDEEDSEEEGEAAEDLVFPAEFAPALVQLLATAPDAAPAPAASGSGGGGGAGGGAGRPLAVRAIALPDPELQLQVAAALWEAGVLACVPPPVPAKPAAAKAKAVAKPAKAAAAKAVPIAAQQAKAAGKPGKQAAAQQAAAGKGGGKAGGGEPAAAGGRKKQRKA